MTIPTKPLRELLYTALREAASADQAHPKEFVAFCATLEEAAMRAIAEYNEPFAKAADNVIDGVPEPVFVLRAQDETADYWVEMWEESQSRRREPPVAKLHEARRIADAMREWPKRRLPD